MMIGNEEKEEKGEKNREGILTVDPTVSRRNRKGWNFMVMREKEDRMMMEKRIV